MLAPPQQPQPQQPIFPKPQPLENPYEQPIQVVPTPRRPPPQPTRSVLRPSADRSPMQFKRQGTPLLRSLMD